MNASSLNISQIQNRLERIVQDFQPSTSQPQRLEPFKTYILALRAKQATYANIKQVLAEQGVHVSESAISRFCREHGTDVRRQRCSIENNQQQPSSTTPTSIDRTEAEPERKFRSLRGPV